MKPSAQPWIYKSRTWILALSALGLAACGGSGGTSSTGLDGGSAGVNFSLQLEGTRRAAVGKALGTKAESASGETEAETEDDAGTLITLSEVRVNIERVDFHLPDGVRCEDVQFTFLDPARCDHDGEATEVETGDDDGTPDQGSGDVPSENEAEGEDEVVVDGPFIADLINGTATPSLTNILIPSGNYERIDVQISEAEANDGLLAAGDPLLGNSLVATGSFEYQGAVHTLKLVLKFSEEIEFENAGGIPVNETGANDVVISLDENAWFQGIQLAACLDSGDLALEADGSLVIDENAGEGDCGDIENRIKDNIENSGSAFRDDEDDDDDGVMDQEDHDDDNDGVDDELEDDSSGAS